MSVCTCACDTLPTEEKWLKKPRTTVETRWKNKPSAASALHTKAEAESSCSGGNNFCLRDIHGGLKRMFLESQNHHAMLGRPAGGVDTTGPQRRLVDYVIVYVCVTVVTPFSFSLSLSIPGTRHRLHNASPPLCCRGGKQRHPASRNTATEAHQQGRALVYVVAADRKVEDREACERDRVGSVFPRQ